MFTLISFHFKLRALSAAQRDACSNSVHASAAFDRNDRTKSRRGCGQEKKDRGERKMEKKITRWLVVAKRYGGGGGAETAHCLSGLVGIGRDVGYLGARKASAATSVQYNNMLS